MKRNWLVIAGILVAIMLYEVVVLRPYNQKYNPAPKSQTLEASSVKQRGSVQNSSERLSQDGKTSLEEGVASATSKPTHYKLTVSQADLQEAYTMQLAHDREVKFFKDGARFGHVKYESYEDRENPETHAKIVTLNNAFLWYSENPTISSCLKKLERVSAKAKAVKYSATYGDLECHVEYSQDSENELLLNTAIWFFSPDKSQYSGSVELLTHEATDDGGISNRYEGKYMNFNIDGDVEVVRGADDLREFQSYRGKVDWVAWGDKYFVSIFLPRGKFNPDLFHKASDLGDAHAVVGMTYPVRSMSNGSDPRYEFATYLGVREINEMKKIQPNLERALDLGFFGTVARFMLWSLTMLNKIFHNYGWSIIALTLLVRLLFWPLNKKVYSSSQKMKEVQPKMEAIKAKYKGADRAGMQQMNMEVMQLYRQHKINPMGSCLPILLQMPIFLGLYGALNNSIHLYQAPFYGWIQDLSSADPYYILPIIWTVSLLITMKLTPQPTSNQPGMPNMKYVMMVMYVFFGFFAKDWPAGLVLYLVVSNVVGVAQQYALKKNSNNQMKVIQEGV